MSRYRLLPTPAQEAVLRGWNPRPSRQGGCQRPFLPQPGAWSGQGDQAGFDGGESAGAVVETAQVVLEVHVQVLAARGLGASPGVPDQFGANALAAGLDGDHDVLQPRVHQAVPQDVDEADDIRAVAG